MSSVAGDIIAHPLHRNNNENLITKNKNTMSDKKKTGRARKEAREAKQANLVINCIFYALIALALCLVGYIAFVM